MVRSPAPFFNPPPMACVLVRPQRSVGHALLLGTPAVRREGQSRGCLFGALLPPLVCVAVRPRRGVGHALLLGTPAVRREGRSRGCLFCSLLLPLVCVAMRPRRGVGHVPFLRAPAVRGEGQSQGRIVLGSLRPPFMHMVDSLADAGRDESTPGLVLAPRWPPLATAACFEATAAGVLVLVGPAGQEAIITGLNGDGFLIAVRRTYGVCISRAEPAPRTPALEPAAPGPTTRRNPIAADESTQSLALRMVDSLADARRDESTPGLVFALRWPPARRGRRARSSIS